MQRTVTTPADLNDEALQELKGWLGISRPSEDALLTNLLHASLALCEAFIGKTPIEQTIEENIPVTPGEYELKSRPVRAFQTAELIDPDAARSPLPTDAFDFRIDAWGRAFITLNSAQDGRCIAVAVRAGIAANWGALPQALKQGAIRLAAFHYRERDNDSGPPALPPASVTALWRPWREVRIA